MHWFNYLIFLFLLLTAIKKCIHGLSTFELLVNMNIAPFVDWKFERYSFLINSTVYDTILDIAKKFQELNPTIKIDKNSYTKAYIIDSYTIYNITSLDVVYFDFVSNLLNLKSNFFHVIYFWGYNTTLSKFKI